MARSFFLHTKGNITVFAALVIIFCATQPIQAQESYAVSFSPLFGMVHGHAEELVYPGENHKAPLLSELLWDMKPVFYYGFSLDLSQVDPRERWGFFADFSLKHGIPGMSGSMEDRDWRSVVNANLTDYSKHDNHSREMFLLDVRGGLSFPFRRLMLLKAYVNVSFMRFRFIGMDGYGIYALESGGEGSGIFDSIIDNSHREEDYSGEKVISYTQEWLTFAPGVSFGYFFHRNFFAELSFLASPLVLCVDLDEHKPPENTQYQDLMQGGILIEPGLRLSYAASKWLEISWEFSWRHISGTKGVTYSRKPIGTGTWVQAGQAGAGLSIINTALVFKLRM